MPGGLLTEHRRRVLAAGAVIMALVVMITATGSGAGQADQVGELMASTATLLDESVLATQQQKSATDQVDAALQQIRAATEQLAIGQQLRFGHAERLEALVRDLDAALNPAHAVLAETFDMPAVAPAGTWR